MKAKNFVLTALAIFIAATVTATKLPTLNVVPMENQKTLVAFEASKPATVEISLKNSLGETLYYKKSKSPVEEVSVIFDFHELKDGIYELCLNFNNCKIRRDLTISDNLVKNVGEERRTFGPYCKLENNLLKISYLNSNQKNVHMNIYHDGKQVTAKKLGKEISIQKIFDLSKLESGQYEIVLGDVYDKYQFVVRK